MICSLAPSLTVLSYELRLPSDLSSDCYLVDNVEKLLQIQFLFRFVPHQNVYNVQMHLQVCRHTHILCSFIKDVPVQSI